PADLVLIWRADTDGDHLDIQLTLFDAGTGTALVHRAKVRGGGVTQLNVVLAALLGTLLLMLLAAALWVFVLAGRVEVDLVPDPGVERQVIAVRLTRSAERPIVDPADFDRRHAGRHVRGFREHIDVERGALFRLVRTGPWWVHVYGTQMRGGEP